MPRNSTTSESAGDSGGGGNNDLSAAYARARCSLVSSSIAASFSILLLNIAVILVSCSAVHLSLRRLSQHRIVSDLAVGLLIENIGELRETVEEYVIDSFAKIGVITFSFYLFVLGLEMDPKSVLRWPGPANKIACAGIISTVGVTLFSHALIKHAAPNLGMNHPASIICALAVGLSATSSPVLTRHVTELKMNKFEIGRLAVRASLASDMLCTSLMCVGVALCPSVPKNLITALRGTVKAIPLAFEAYFIHKFVNPLIICRLNGRNADGKPIRGLDMAAFCTVSFLLCYSSDIYGFKPSFNSFIVGLCLPRDGRISNFLISRINFILTTFMLPLYLVLVGLSSDYRTWIRPHIDSRTLLKLAITGLIGVAGKLTGTLVYGVHHGLQWPEAAALGLLLNVKGYFHIFCAHKAAMAQIIDMKTMMVMVLVAVGTVVPVPLVVAFLVRRARARARRIPMGLQWCSPSGPVRILVGLHRPEDLTMAVNVMEAMRGQRAGGGGGLVANVVDMVEMTDKAAASLVHGEETEPVTVSDEGIVAMREQIGSALQSYLDEIGEEGVRLNRMLAVSMLDNMHEDICGGAHDCMSVLVVLPFHRRQRVDGAMVAGHPGHRPVNQKVLHASPCSVAIYVNRSPSRGSHSSSLSVGSQNVCVVFIGGADDREALAYAARMAYHPGIKLTLLRFLASAAAKAKPLGPGRRVLNPAGRRGMEQEADEECFSEFYEMFVEGGKGVGYVEKQVESGPEMVAALREVEGQYQLFIVGIGRDRPSVLTAGMSEWAECPELGPIGDILASSDFSVSASVLAIQQHRIAKRYNVIDDEFLPV